MQSGIVYSKYNTQKTEVYVSTSWFFFISGTESVKYIKMNHLSLNSDLENYKP